MEKFQTLHSTIVPLPLNDVDTDMIIPAQFLTSISREGYGENVFRRLRDEDKNFPLQDPFYKNSSILVVGKNFGCGSSREHAVWALMGAGFRAIIGKSFADIFKSNAGKNGLLLVELQEESIDKLLRSEDKTAPVTVNLEEQSVTLPDNSKETFQYDSFRKHCLLQGIDDLDYITAAKEEIAAYRHRHEEVRFYTTQKPNHEAK